MDCIHIMFLGLQLTLWSFNFGGSMKLAELWFLFNAMTEVGAFLYHECLWLEFLGIIGHIISEMAVG